jgi:hypothetical protein
MWYHPAASSTTDFVCDLCTGMPEPGDSGKTYVFELRNGDKFHDGTPLTAADVKASWDHIISPPEGVLSVQAELLYDGRLGRSARPENRRVPPQIRDNRVSTGARDSMMLLSAVIGPSVGRLIDATAGVFFSPARTWSLRPDW